MEKDRRPPEADASNDRSVLELQTQMGRVTVRFPEAMIDQLDQLVENGVYPNRSEAMRASVRKLVYRSLEADDHSD
jgi:metal-responsive CopG/Arc/MetJ family transcriptional regulator